jgi:hypothetical protein
MTTIRAMSTHIDHRKVLANEDAANGGFERNA